MVSLARRNLAGDGFRHQNPKGRNFGLERGNDLLQFDACFGLQPKALPNPVDTRAESSAQRKPV